MSHVYLEGLKLANYRGIGSTEQTMAPFKTFNFFIGANNSGKSAILSFIHQHLPITLTNRYAQTGRQAKSLEPLDLHTKDGTRATAVRMAQGISTHTFGSAIINKISNSQLKTNATPFIKTIVDRMAECGHVWLCSAVPYSENLNLIHTTSTVKPSISEDQWRWLWSALCNRQGGSLDIWVNETLQNFMATQSTSLPRIHMIPAIRQISNAVSRPVGALADYSGTGLIQRLAEIQNPDHDRLDDKDLFNKINEFLSTVTGVHGAHINIPHSCQHILVHMDGKVLPLSSLGSGIHEVIMLASFCTLSQNSIVCIEEPEIHLHPLLQRKLIQYLQDNTSNQYFIATHSASFIDTPGAAIFHVTNTDGQTHIRESILNKERFSICVDLGYKASDLVQANAIVWVEGPSDRIYIAHWIKEVAPDLIEGIHYSIMFYGGRLLRHLSAGDENTDDIAEFISLRSLNRHTAIVMDSDRISANDSINSTKQRLINEFEEHGGVAWLTAGREIENYLPYPVLQATLSEIYKASYVRADKSGAFDHALYFRRRKKITSNGKTETKTVLEKDIDKIKVAQLVCRGNVDLTVLDLRIRLDALVEMIRKAN